MQLEHRIEEASFNAWPALRHVFYDGWLLRFSDGYTKRTNSVNVLGPSVLHAAEKIPGCEAHYRRQGLPTIFRLTSLSAPPGLDELLAERGYLHEDPSLVLNRQLGEATDAGSEVPIEEVVREEWIEHFIRLSGYGARTLQTLTRMLDKIAGEIVTVVVRDGREVVACGRGAPAGTLFGLFDLVVAPEARRKGHGRRLIEGMYRLARRRGCAESYLQVTESNMPALNLYWALGFEELYRYWYRRAPDATP